jgi:hypothetical protein
LIVIPSRSRPHNFQRLIAACLSTGTSTTTWVRLDEDDASLSQYAALSMPKNWEVIIGQRVPLSEVYNEAYRKIPETSHWIFIADDVVPVTYKWDQKLIEAAGPDGMAVPTGGETTGGYPHFALGGELVRSIGWLALPGLDRIYIDTCWRDIADQRGVLRYVPEVTLEHRHFSNGKALFDRTYKKEKKAHDKIIYENWKRSTHAYLP